MKPLLLLSSGDGDADFLYATGFDVERGIYLDFGEGERELLVSPLELERAQAQSRVGRVRDIQQAGLERVADLDVAAARLAARLLHERGHQSVRISPRLPAAWYEELRAADVEPEIETELFVAGRRRKTPEEASFIRAAQHAAEVACAAVVRRLAEAEIREGLLWIEDAPVTSERLMAEAEAVLTGIGYAAGKLIIAGAPGNAMGHFRGEGEIRAHAPIVLDIFPQGRKSHYHGDLTRTVVVGEAGDEVRRMHAACLAALEAAIELIRAGANGRDVHHAACRVLVEHGFGSTTKGFEGDTDRPRMNHSLGHGVGLEVHEAPYLRDLDYELQGHDVVTVEPGLYLAGLGGVRVEDTGMVTEDGFENFTELTRSLDPKDYL
jgi:Xaa-Pro aminopeptidase